MSQSRSGRGGKRAGNNPELAQVVIAGSSQCSYVLSKRQFLVQDDPKVPDRSGEQKSRDFSRQGLRVQPVQLLAGAQPNILSFMRICSKRLDDIQGIESIGGRDIVRIALTASDADRNVCRIERHRHNNDLRENKMREEDQYLQSKAYREEV